MTQGNGEFDKYKIFLIETLKRHETDRKEDRNKNESDHKEIMDKLTKMEKIVSANKNEIRNKQLQWGSIGGAVIIAAKELVQWALTRGAG